MLQKASSLTAWRRILDFYRAWTAAAERSRREAEARGWGDKSTIHADDYARSVDGLAHLEVAVHRLAQGDKRIFAFPHNQHLLAAQDGFNFSWQTVDRVLQGENGIDPEHTLYWNVYAEAIVAMTDAWRLSCMHVLEPKKRKWTGSTLYGIWLQRVLKEELFPEQLAPVPDPAENTLVRSFGTTPCSGIWEPIEVPQVSWPRRLLGAPQPQPPFRIAGAMNYLHGGATAPCIGLETDSENSDRRTTWRLLWRDDRYVDGTVPPEEALYRFSTRTP